MTLHAGASLRCFITLMVAGFSVRPEKVDSLKKMFDDASAPPCGLDAFQTLDAESTLGDARALFLSGCEEKYTSEQCNFAAEELWFGLELASTGRLEMDSDLCESLRLAVSASERSGLAQDSNNAASMEASVSRKLRRSSGSVGKNIKDTQQVSQKSDDEWPDCTNPSVLTLNRLPETGIAGGRCMDGTTAGFYYSPPSGGASDVWVIFLEGGGMCYTEEDCDERAGTSKGSNSSWTETIQIGNKCQFSQKLVFLSDDSTYNQHFHNAHHVYVPYCTGDTHAGRVSHPTSDQWGYYFDGHLNFKAIVREMVATLPSASRVLLYGTSAGGKGTFHNCDWLRGHMNRNGRSADVFCAPHSGWFMPGDTEDNDDTQAPPTPWEFWKNGTLDTNGEAATKDILRLQRVYLPPECTSAVPDSERWRCYTVHVMYPYIVAPVFVFQDTFDQFKIMSSGGLPGWAVSTDLGEEYIAYFGRAMVKSTGQVANHPFGKTGDALFLASCFVHGSGRSARLGSGGWHKDDAIADWFWRDGEGQIPNILIDDCEMDSPGLPCNPRCPGVEDF